MVFYDKMNATTFDQAQRNFNANDNCVSAVLRYWVSQILNPSQVTPEQAFSLTVTYANELFASKKCLPSSLKH
jgi:hypothetical protein